MADENNDDKGGTSGGGNDRTFTQADVDRLIQERLGRERAKYADYDDLKKAKDRLDEIEAANKSELDKAIARAEKAEKERDDALGNLKKVRLESAIVAEASKQGANDCNDVIRLLDSGSLTVADDGTVQGLDKAVEDLLKSKPYLRSGKDQGQKTPTGGADGGARSTPATGQLSREDLKGMTPEQIVEANAKGQFDTLKTSAPQ